MNLFSGLKGEGLNKEKGILEILNPLSRQDAYHKLFVRKSRLTTEHVFVSFVDESFSSIINDAVYLCTDGKVYDKYGNGLHSNGKDYYIKLFVGRWDYERL